MNCPVCKSENIAYKPCEMGSPPLQAYYCTECGLIFHDRQTPPGWYEGDGYRGLVQGRNAVTERNLQEQAGRFAKLLPHIPPHGLTMLDVGCSAGVVLDRFADAGYTVAGVEPSEVFRAYCLGRGLNVVPSLDHITGKFDVITILHVLEHLWEPVSALRRLRELAADGAYLMVEVPVFRTRIRMQLQHPRMFTAKSLKVALMLAGFNPVKVVDPHTEAQHLLIVAKAD